MRWCIDVRDLRKVFPSTGRGRAEVVALDGLDFSVCRGEIYSLLGPSGCGKSTALDIIAGFETVSSGSVLIEGDAVTQPSPDRAVVFQEPQLFPWLTVMGNVLFGPRVQRHLDGSEAIRRADELLRATGLQEFKHHHVYQLSGGMRQRVAIARALINQPRVLLMDEPFGALDAQTRIAMQELLLSIWATFTPTILFVTHDVEEALFLGDRVGVMSTRPGRMELEVVVPIKRPRTIEDVTSTAFVELKARILRQLRVETLVNHDRQ
jgi:ABC-type nitrate/sulfonate/bicarbonate transport system ATPase subunit